MQLYFATEQGLGQIHYNSRLTAYLITMGNCKRKFARGRLLLKDIFKLSTDAYFKIQNGKKIKTKVVCKYMIKNKTFQKI